MALSPKVLALLCTSLAVSSVSSCVSGGSSQAKSNPDSAPYIGAKDASGFAVNKKIASAQHELAKLRSAKIPDGAAIAALTKQLEKFQLDTHWHAAYGVYNCDHYEAPIDGSAFPDPTGIHGHDDGLIHIHPFVASASGSNAKLGLFLQSMQLKITTSAITYPGGSQISASKGCLVGSKHKKARIVVYRWDSLVAKSAKIYTEDFDQIPLGRDDVYALIVAPEETPIPMPPTAKALLGPADVVKQG